jgi:hypothetical protein
MECLIIIIEFTVVELAVGKVDKILRCPARAINEDHIGTERHESWKWCVGAHFRMIRSSSRA